MSYLLFAGCVTVWLLACLMAVVLKRLRDAEDACVHKLNQLKLMVDIGQKIITHKPISDHEVEQFEALDVEQDGKIPP